MVNIQWVGRVSGILRMFTWLFAIVQFGTMCDWSVGGTSYSDFGGFKYDVAAGVLAFVWSLVVMALLTVELNLPKVPVAGTVYGAGDLFFALLEVIAGIVAADEYNKKQSKYADVRLKDLSTSFSGVSKMKDNVQASIVFAFFTCFLLVLTALAEMGVSFLNKQLFQLPGGSGSGAAAGGAAGGAVVASGSAPTAQQTVQQQPPQQQPPVYAQQPPVYAQQPPVYQAPPPQQPPAEHVPTAVDPIPEVVKPAETQ